MSHLLEAPRIAEMMEAAKARGETEHKETAKALFWCQLRMNIELMLQDLAHEIGENPHKLCINSLREMATDKAIEKLIALYHGEDSNKFVEERLSPMSKVMMADTTDFIRKARKNFGE